jgi:multiple sugar transport system ATP-binding protein
VTTVALQNVSKVFPDGTVAVDRLNLEAADGEFVVLLGPSGCGKSTVLRVIAGLEDQTAGDVLLNGRIANDLSPRERKVAMIFQDYSLYPHMNVRENIGFPLRIAGVGEQARVEQVADVATALGIGDVLGRRPANLSGGQRQRVAMGRAVVRRPELFLLDEPLSNLDSGLRAHLRAEITSLVRQLGVTTIYVTHDQAEALTMADRIAILRRGVLQDVGTPTEVYSRPRTLYVAAFLGSPRMNLFEASVYVHLDRFVALTLGEQTLHLPWHDMRARQVAHYHGERIVVGVRAEALAPAAADNAGDIVHGRVLYIEHHGHESLAFIDVGAYGVQVDEAPGDAQSGRSGSRLSKVAQVFRRGDRSEVFRRGDRTERADDGDGASGAEQSAGRTGTMVLEPRARHYRPRAELAVRLPPYPNLRAGDQLRVSVRVDQLHFFDAYGQRIDVGWHGETFRR